MADQADLERLLPVLNSYAPKQVRFPDMPMDQALKEAEIMLAAAIEDAGKFDSVGLDQSRLDDLSLAVGVARLTQAQLTAALGELKEAAAKWAEEEPLAYELRADLLATVTYGLRNIQDAIKAIKRIREGKGHADMIVDLKALAELCRKYQPHLEEIKFDIGLIDIADKKADELGNLYAKAFIEKSTAGAKEIRDRAFTHMRKLMGDVLDAAEYVFRKDKERLDFYYSSYRSRQRTSSKTETAIEEEVEETAEVPAT